MLRLAGCKLEPNERERQAQLRLEDKLYPSRAWVIRVPGVFIGAGGTRERSSFETIVMAPTADYAWDVATQSDAWTRLPFCIDNVQIFPKDPEVITSDNHPTR